MKGEISISLFLAFIGLVAAVWPARQPESPHLFNPAAENQSRSPMDLTKADPELVNRFDLSGLPVSAIQEPQSTPADPFAVLDGWQLTGIIGTDEIPLILMQRGNNRRTLRIGDRLADLELARINGRSAVFKSNAAERALSLPDNP